MRSTLSQEVLTQQRDFGDSPIEAIDLCATLSSPTATAHDGFLTREHLNTCALGASTADFESRSHGLHAAPINAVNVLLIQEPLQATTIQHGENGGFLDHWGMPGILLT
jgi:hypothetical protein